MAYIPSECTLQEYEEQIYSGDNSHKLFIQYGNTIIGEDETGYASWYCDGCTFKKRILDNGSDTFKLDNFVSQECELSLHDVTISDLDEDIIIKIGSFVEDVDDYVYIPMGVFKVVDNPETYNGITKYKLKDKSVEFDFNYNAEPLITTSGGSATKLQILLDICDKAGITYVGSQTFDGYDDEVGIYDSTISARVYVSYLAEQCGCIATMTRDGELTFIDLTNLTTRTIDFNLLESFECGEPYKISKVEYESGIIKFTNGDDEFSALYLNGANPYITTQDQIDSIYTSLHNFTIDSLSTGKVLGNPTIDAWDLITFTYNNETYVTLAQHDLIFYGTLTMNFGTKIDYQARQSNVTVNSQETYKKTIRAEINNIEGSLEITANKVDDVVDSYTTLKLDSDALNVRVGNVETQSNVNQAEIEAINNKINDLNYSFTSQALEISSSNSNFISKLDNQGLRIYNLAKLIAIFNKNGTGVNNLIITTSFQFQHLYMKKTQMAHPETGVTVDVMSCYWIESLIATLEDLED